jgi:hypothetical protein
MKNIHLLPTDKPSRLCYVICTENSTLTLFEDEMEKGKRFFPQNTCITNSEEIKEGDWYYWTVTNSVQKAKKDNLERLPKISDGSHKIILTTDQDLIKDGVQAIDDEFLEWFVKNPSCEDVEVEKQMLCDYCGQEHCDNLRCRGYKDSVWYEIIIPREEPKPHSFCETPEEKCTMNYCDENGCLNRKRELVEPKQQTLEEAKLRQLFKNRSNCYADTGRFENDGSYSEGEVIQAMDENCFINVIKEWQADRMYGDAEVLDILDKFLTSMVKGEKTGLIEDWFEQHKNK